MARNLDPKCKQCRRLGEKLLLKGERCFSAKCSMVKRNYPPGIHGQKSKISKTTSYAKQLREKQKAKKIYGLLEKQFRLYYLRAKKLKGNVSQNLLMLLFMRFDNVIYKAGMANSRQMARILITHGHLQINSINVNIPSFQIKPGQTISIKPSSQKRKYWQDLFPLLAKKERPDWITYDAKDQNLKIINYPEAKEMENIFDPKLIIEFYSK